MDDNTPVIIGVGEASERIGAPGYAAHSPVELAALAARAALDDAGAAAAIGPRIEVIAAIRQFEVSGPRAVAPFGKSNNFPRSVARRIGADPQRAILEPVGGQGPQHLVNEFAHAIGRGEMRLALICGSEAISTVRDLATKGETRDWSEEVEGQLEDRGYGVDGLVDAVIAEHGARTPIQVYAMYENARRARRGLSREAYLREMGDLFAPFTVVASGNPHAMSQSVFTPEALATVTPQNRVVADPFPRRMVARDQANQGAAVLIASVGMARELGVPEDRWVYLHGGADVAERSPFQRNDLSAYPAAVLAAKQALDGAGVGVGDIAAFDLYSCFPIAVFSVRDELGLAADDPRPLTVTGGLPFFGGAGNNYSMHAIASLVRALRAKPGSYGLLGANGGFLSKYSVGVYATKPREWRPFDSRGLQAAIDGWPAPAPAPDSALDGTVETYTIDYGREAPHGVLVCRTDAGERFMAMTSPEHPAVLEAMRAGDPLGARVSCALDARGRRVAETIALAG
ncbi:acetyl-CoA acetyltransferase [Phenylobacterium sp.]|uniref:acetyl-CoA acetyltransferase n=1 Tax=Phenylobacterium sp. TaxID=1871053 RepID=UPI0025ED285B|nr:acetyl-CoA acetyltransferase [Phenylobacterium sp.]MBX3485479.1 acetyl-CoA acetyltransferase [Phenylobacterium sp.]MCW5759286.1 acetyl-CoA acetyltransferase [Phenylobacterium sp.]